MVSRPDVGVPAALSRSCPGCCGDVLAAAGVRTSKSAETNFSTLGLVMVAVMSAGALRQPSRPPCS